MQFRELRCLIFCACFTILPVISVGAATPSEDGVSAVRSLGSFDRHAEWSWQPVSIGAGGWMRGMVIHPKSSTIRYARSDTWGAFRWNPARREWTQMINANSLPRSIQTVNSANPAEKFNLTATPHGDGVSSIAIDPQRMARVYVAMTVNQPGDTNSNARSTGNVYYSRDKGITFKASTGLDLATGANPACDGGELDAQNTAGERLRVDPVNSNIVYLGSQRNGVYISADAGVSFRKVTGGNIPAACKSVGNVIMDGRALVSRTINGVTGFVSKVIYVVVDSDGSSGIFRSGDGGATWTDIAVGRSELTAGDINGSTLASDGALWVTSGSNVLRYADGVWTPFQSPRAGSSIAVDPLNPKTVYVTSRYDLGIARTTDGGTSWTDLGGPVSIKSGDGIDWINTKTSRGQSTGTLLFDSSISTVNGKGRLWVSGGNAGVMYADIDTSKQLGSSTGLNWIELAKGIEQMVGQNAIIPPGGNNAAILTFEDEAVFHISNPTKFTAIRYDIDTSLKGNNDLASNGMVAFSPDTPSVMVTNPANLFASAYRNGAFRNNFAGYSVNYGKNWNYMPSIRLTDNDNSYGGGSFTNNPENLVGGQIAISARGSVLPGKGQSVWTGQDNIAWLSYGTNSPYGGNGAFDVRPRYSLNGGATWLDGKVFDENNVEIDFINRGLQYMFVNASKQTALVADPVTPLTFYALGVSRFMVTTDGGKTWRIPQSTSAAFAPAFDFFINAKMQAVPGRKGDLWLSTGPGDPRAGGYLFHSTNGGQNWTRVVTAKSHNVTIGKGAPGKAYAVYMYGKPTETQPYGVYRSDDEGVSWYLISGNGKHGYPFNQFNIPADLAASPDREGLVYINFTGMSAGWGYQKSLGNPYPQ